MGFGGSGAGRYSAGSVVWLCTVGSCYPEGVVDQLMASRNVTSCGAATSVVARSGWAWGT